jgi:hypothetical protein
MGAPFLSPASASSEAVGHHRFAVGDKVRWHKALAGSDGLIAVGTVSGVVEDARHKADPVTGRTSTMYKVYDDELRREVLISSAALRRLRE